MFRTRDEIEKKPPVAQASAPPAPPPPPRKPPGGFNNTPPPNDNNRRNEKVDKVLGDPQVPFKELIVGDPDLLDGARNRKYPPASQEYLRTPPARNENQI